MYKILKNILFLMSPETAHKVVMESLKIFLKIPFIKSIMMQFLFVENPVNFIGLKFLNGVGMAAGFDKNAEYLNELEALGFGFVEIGTVTPLAQPGNEKPRLFRLKEDEALINRMGFNNEGVDAVVERLKHRPKNLIVGGNIGKNKITPNENAHFDYEICFTKLYNYVDFFVVNVSSPNTQNLRELQEKEPLKKILSSLILIRKNFNGHSKIQKPILLKIAPDLSNSQLDDIIEIILETGLDGIVATNTTIKREKLQTPDSELQTIGSGGLSGKVLSNRSTEVIKYIHQASSGKIPIIGVGGIHDVNSAKEKTEAGAELIEIYTSFIYNGPFVMRRIAKQLN